MCDDNNHNEIHIPEFGNEEDRIMQEFNLDEVMEKIREEVAKNEIERQNFQTQSDGTLTETKSFLLIKKIQLFLKQFPLFAPINDLAVRFKRHIPKYRRRPIAVNDLLIYDDEKFMTVAYNKILLRDPDIQGLTHYLPLLQSGELTKIQILGRLRYSSEGRHVQAKIKGLLLKFLLSYIRH